MKIIEKKLVELIEYENNPRLNQGAVNAVAESIRQFGFKVPIIIDGSGVIIAGHTRKKAAELLGLDKVPCIIADDLTEEQVKAFRLADNKTAELADWDFQKLEKELQELAEMDIDFSMQDFGFYAAAGDDFSDIFNTEEKPAKQESEEEEVEGFKVVVYFENEEEAEKLAEDLEEQGYQCEVLR